MLLPASPARVLHSLVWSVRVHHFQHVFVCLFLKFSSFVAQSTERAAHFVAESAGSGHEL